MRPRGGVLWAEHESVPLPIWQEVMAGVEMAFLRISPVFWGYGVPHGDGSAVVLVPGFLGTDLSLSQLKTWLGRIGYRPFYSGISLNAECPNLLIRRHVNEAIEDAYQSTGRKIHLIGHSLGGAIALAAASQLPGRVASVITLAAPIRGVAGHGAILRTAELVRKRILERNGQGVLPACYTAECTCRFLESLKGKFPKSVRQTAIYTRTDGILDWRVCRTGDPAVDYEVSATHIGLAFSPLVYSVLAERLAGNQA
ncbi:MAG TPA: alpha/beta fold hydrolase [Terriglobia bacterium]|nr:alpha/beta fold hydrolase [Terriglobia bacterium]